MKKTKITHLRKEISKPLHKFAIRAIRKYGAEVIENRALADFRDGLKPVQRRILWAMESSTPRMSSGGKKYKCARVTGEVMGKYHPHADSYPTLVNMYWKSLPLVDKQGNFGPLNSGASAPRYTETSLSKYTEEVFLNKRYLQIADYMDTYDGENREPIVLPALLPNILLNGVEGIAVGVSCGIPSFELDSVVKMINIGLERPTTAKDCFKYLAIKYNDVFDCKVITENAILKEFYETGKGRLTLEPVYTIHNNQMIITKFPPHFVAESAVIKIMGDGIKKKGVDGVMQAGDFSGRKEGSKFIITLKASVSIMDRPKVFDKCIKALREGFNMQLNVIEKTSATKRKFHSWDMPTLINRWIAWRASIEVKRAQNDARLIQERIDLLNLYVFACFNLAKIIPIIKSNKPDVDKRLAAVLKITIEQASIILSMTLRRLTGMSVLELKEDIIKQKKLLAQANEDAKHPNVAIKRDLADVVAVAKKALLIQAEDNKSTSSHTRPAKKSK